jgi:hypothetical protein
MGRQPSVLDGATVKLLREGETPDVWKVSHDYVVHVALRDYPVEKRTKKKIEANCTSLGFLREIDPACFEAPDLATVHVVLQLHNPGEIPHELRIEYRDGSISVVPVEIVRIWHHSHSYSPTTPRDSMCPSSRPRLRPLDGFGSIKLALLILAAIYLCKPVS